MNTKVDENWWKVWLAFQHGIPSICLTKLFTFSRLISNGIGASRNRNWCLFQNRPLQYRLFQCRLHQIVQYRWNPLFWGLLGLIRKRLVEFRLDFLAGFLQVSLAGFLQVWLTFLPSSCLCSRCARPCWFWFFGYRKWPPSVSLGLGLGLAGSLCRLRHVVTAKMYDGETE